MTRHECKMEHLRKVPELSDVFNHNLRVMDAVSPRFPLLRLAALLHDVGKVRTREVDKETGDYHFFGHEVVGADLVRNFCEKFRFSNEETEYLVTVVRNHMYFVTHETKAKSIRKWLRGNPHYRDNLRLRLADRKGNLAKVGKAPVPFMLKELIKRVREVERDKPPLQVTDLAVNGHDLIAMGLKPGPAFGKILNGLLEIVLEDPSKNHKGYLLHEVERLVQWNDS